MVLDGLRGVAVRADTERVLPINFEQVGSFVENVGDGLVVHRLKIKQDWTAGPAVTLKEGSVCCRELKGRYCPESMCQTLRFGGCQGRARWSGEFAGSGSRRHYAALVTFAACGPF